MSIALFCALALRLVRCYLSRRLQLPAKEQVRSYSQNDEYQNQSENVEGEVGVQHVQLFEGRFGIFEVTVDL